MSDPSDPSNPLEDIEATVRRSDPDRWLASRFIADVDSRGDVIALYALDHVLARVPAMVSEPLMGEIRLTWWSEALDEIWEGRAVRSHPVALALAGAARRGLARGPLDALLAARFTDLDAEPLADEAAVLAYAGDTGGALAQAAAQRLGAPPGLVAAREAGRAYALGAMAYRRAIGGDTRLPPSLSQERLRALVSQALAQARAGLGDLPLAAFPAVAHAALARPYARGARLTVLGKQLRLVWSTATGGL
jgi:phytoene synthase